MKGKLSGQTRGVARVFLRKNRAGKALPFAIKGLRFQGPDRPRGSTAGPLWQRASFRLTDTPAAAQWRPMPTPAIQALLILQDRDTKRLALEAQLKQTPADIARVEAKIAAEKAAIDAAKHEVTALEVRKKNLENDIGSAEAKLAKYRTQQSLVKKNDEFKALGHEIETTEKAISELEGQELEIMYAIDEARKTFVAAEAVLKGNISGHESRIKTLREREISLTAELKSAQAEVATARAPIELIKIRLYDRVAARNMPAVVAVRDAKCGGCHLKVSSEVESAARGKGTDPLAPPPTCDQCGRIVYWEG